MKKIFGIAVVAALLGLALPLMHRKRRRMAP